MPDATSPWPRAAPLLARALQRDDTLETVREAIAEGRAQLWPGEAAAAVTHLTRGLHIWLAAGRMEELLAMDASAEAFARANGCDLMSVRGRKGWERALRPLGYAPLLVKELK